MSAKPERPRPTAAHIAAAAGVSVPTVSKVINGRADVAPATRAAVEALLVEHNYVRPRRARKGAFVDILFNQLGSPWASEIIQGAERVARTAGTGIAVAALDDGPDAERQWLDAVTSRGSRGIILALSELPKGAIERLAAVTPRIVMVDPVGDFDAAIPSVGAANWSGGMAATRHLVELGHRRVATITGPSRYLCSQARLDGYRAALERAGIAADPALVRQGDFHHATALASALDLLDLADPPTAVFAASDEQALGVYEAVRQRGLRVPDDLSVVGFDDVPMSQWVSPPLTTVRQPLREMAALATRMVLAPPEEAPAYNDRVELSTTLIVRASTAPAL